MSNVLEGGEKLLKDGEKVNHSKEYASYFFAAVAGIIVANLLFAVCTPPKPVHSTSPFLPRPSLPTPSPRIVKTAPLAVLNPRVILPAVEKLSLPMPPQLVLNGIFSSGDQSYALINNRIVKPGESVAGARVKSISFTTVELEFGSQKITLSNGK